MFDFCEKEVLNNDKYKLVKQDIEKQEKTPTKV